MTHRSPSLNSTRSSRLSSWLSGLPQMFDTHQNSRNSSPIDFEYRDEYISDNLDIQQDVQPEVQQINKLDGTESTEKPWNLQPHWHNLLVPSRYHYENLVPPSRGVQEGFLLN